MLLSTVSSQMSEQLRHDVILSSIPKQSQWACGNSGDVEKSIRKSEANVFEGFGKRDASGWTGVAVGVLNFLCSATGTGFTVTSFVQNKKNKPLPDFQSKSFNLNLGTIDINSRTYYAKINAGSKCVGLNKGNIDTITCELARNLNNNIGSISSGSKCLRVGDTGSGLDILLSVGTDHNAVNDIDCNEVSMGNCDWSKGDGLQDGECNNIQLIMNEG